MFRLLRIPVSILAAILLAGCAHSIKLPLLGTIDNTPPPSRDAAMQRLETKPPCCHAWADLPFHDILPREPREFTVDRFSPVAVLDGEHTHFLTFELPKFRKSYRVVFQTQPSARHLGNSFLFAPTVTLLNANYEPISRTDVALCVYINWRPSMSGGFGAVTIDNPNAQYLVVTTSKKQLAATTYWAQSPTSFSDVNVPSASAFASIKPSTPVTRGSFNVPHGPEGTLYLGKMTPAYADAVDNGLCGKPQPGAGLLPELRNALHNR
ncbi:MAG TPA: hypothetical protein VFX04_10430 [Rhodanobacteraceae bacterium]|nr:hypothetical protein [Rhodanobacteraceae bacterium]